MKHLVAIVDARFDNSVRTGGQMQFSSQAACVAGVSKKSADEFFIWRHRLAILAALGRARVTPCEKRRPAWSADRALRVSLCERHSLTDQIVNAGSVDVRVA